MHPGASPTLHENTSFKVAWLWRPYHTPCHIPFPSVENLLADVLFCTIKEMTAIRILSLLSVQPMDVFIDRFSSVSLSECPKAQSSLHLLPLSLNGLSLCFSFSVGYSDKLCVVMLNTNDLLTNLGIINTTHYYTPPASPPGAHRQAFPFPFHSQQS